MNNNRYCRTRILTIDGGGVRGLIPAVVLAYLEQKLQILSNNPEARIVDYFDLFSGTSTGALIVAGLLTPNRYHRPRYTAQQTVSLYEDNIETIFHASLLQSVKSASGILDVKYAPEGLERVLNANFDHCQLKDLLKPCLIPIYNLNNSKNYYFRQRLASENPEHNYHLTDVLRAATAAPAYFTPAQITTVDGKHTHCFVDGGVFAINPALSAYAEYRHLHPYHHAKDTMMLSLGTGTESLQIDCQKTQHWGAMEWRDIGSNMIATALPQASHEQLEAVYSHSPYYLRLNKAFDKAHQFSLDNSERVYLDYLIKLGAQVVKTNKTALDKFAQQLIDNDPHNNSNNGNSNNHMRLTHYLDEGVRSTPKHNALIGLDTALNYQTLRTHALSVSSYLSNHAASGVVAIMLPNLLAFPVVLFGAWYNDRTVTLVNPLLTSDELLKQCLDAQVRTIIIAKMFLKTLQTILPKTAIKNVITVEVGDLQPKLKRYLVNGLSFVKHGRIVRRMGKVRFASLHSILSAPATYSSINFDNDIALLQYTGGTSGTLKAATLTHQNILANVEQIQQWLDGSIDSNSLILTALPLYHIFALSVNLLLFIRLKATNVLVANPRQMKQMISPLKKYPIEVITGVNTLFATLIRSPAFAKLDWSHFKFTIGGGMAVDKKIAKQWQQQTGKPITQGYGLSECSPVVSVDANDITDFSGSVGKALVGTHIKIINKQLEECAIKEIGEICIKGPQVMASYWRKTQLNEEVFTQDGFFRSGDLGYLDTQKRLFIVDRLKEMIIVSGFNVYPNEVEQVLNQHPDVIESACVGVQDGQGGQKVKAFVVKTQGASLSKKQLLSYCQDYLSHYKIPKTIKWRNALPKSAVGKILKRKLLDL